MRDRNKHTAIFPGMFDPCTHGHLDIIERASRLYDRLIVGVGINPLKEAVAHARPRHLTTRMTVARGSLVYCMSDPSRSLKRWPQRLQYSRRMVGSCPSVLRRTGFPR